MSGDPVGGRPHVPQHPHRTTLLTYRLLLSSRVLGAMSTTIAKHRATPTNPAPARRVAPPPPPPTRRSCPQLHKCRCQPVVHVTRARPPTRRYQWHGRPRVPPPSGAHRVTPLPPPPLTADGSADTRSVASVSSRPPPTGGDDGSGGSARPHAGRLVRSRPRVRCGQRPAERTTRNEIKKKRAKEATTLGHPRAPRG